MSFALGVDSSAAYEIWDWDYITVGDKKTTGWVYEVTDGMRGRCSTTAISRYLFQPRVRSATVEIFPPPSESWLFGSLVKL